MPETPDYYQILGVSPDADEVALKAAYRKLSKQHHPDFGGEPRAFAAVAEAADVLLDAAKRADYDRDRRRRKAPGAKTAPTGAPRREVPRIILACPACGTRNRVIDSPIVVTAKCGQCGASIPVARPEADSFGKIFRDAVSDLAGHADVASALDRASDKLRHFNETLRRTLDEHDAPPERPDPGAENDPLRRAESRLDELDAWADRLNRS